MIIQHNISALNSHRQLGINNAGTSKNLEKLSSGFKVNRAGDDAAGLAISEKMRGQIRGLAMAEQNANNGISLIQTAEGGLNETHAILQRMRELAVQSSNGTYKDEVDRENLDKEVQALKSEITRISESTHYNNIKLLDGSLSGNKGIGTWSISAGSVVAAGTDVEATAIEVKLDALEAAVNGQKDAFELVYKDQNGNLQNVKVEYTGTTTETAEGAASAVVVELNKTALANDFNITTDGSGAIVFEAKEAGSSKFQVLSAIQISDVDNTAVQNAKAATQTADTGTDAAYTIDLAGVAAPVAAGTNNYFEIDGQKFQIVALGKDADNGYTALYTDDGAVGDADQAAQIAAQLTKLGISATSDGTDLHVLKSTTDKTGTGLTFQIGANGGADQRVSLSVGDMSAAGIGVAGVSIATREEANASIEIIDNAINMVSGTRADLGALQNRLEHTLNNLGVTKENLTAAESSIRDVDMAKEMMEFTKNNILVQASQAMLAQANQLPQGVLSLLR